MPDLSQWAAEIRDTAAEVIADTRRTRERSRRLMVEAAELLAARQEGRKRRPPGDIH